MFLIKLAFKNLTRHKRRTLITAGVIALAIFFYIFFDSMLIGLMDKSFASIINFESGHVQIANKEYWENKDELPLTDLIPDNLISKNELSEIDEVQGLLPQLNFSANLNNGIDQLPVEVRGIDPDNYVSVFTVDQYFVEGKMFNEDEYQVVMGKRLAQLMDLKVGDYITLLLRTKQKTYNTIDAVISGLLHTPNAALNENIVLVPLSIAQQALNVDSKVSQIVIRLNDRSHTSQVIANLHSKLFKNDNSVNVFSWRDSAEFMLAMQKAQQAENKIILGIILLIAAAGIVNTIILSALERMEEIGMMKALGLKEKEIVFTFSLEAAGIGIVGGLAGCLLGGIAVVFFHNYGIDFFNTMQTNISSFGIPVMGRIYGGWNPAAFVFVYSFGVIVSIIVSILPAVWAARKDPVEAIYHR